MWTHATIQPATNLAVPLSVLRNHVRVTNTHSDDLLSLYCQSATNVIETYTARSLINQTLAFTSTPTYQPYPVSMTTGPAPIYPMWLTGIVASPYRRIELLRSPVSQVQSVTVTTLGVTQTLSPLAYVIDTQTAPAALILTGYTLLYNDILTVTYVAGYGPDHTSVPKALQHAILLIVGATMSHRGDDDLDELPSIAKRLADPYRIHYFGSVSQDGR